MGSGRAGSQKPGRDLQEMTDSAILRHLADVIEARKDADPAASYVAKLLHEGEEKMLKKIAEESAEVLMASKDGDKPHLVREVADLWFHCLVLLAHHDLRPEAVLDEFRRREGISGIDEKASRKVK
jgi:phosphoribosyl-ATP pyrophosphohydrolase